MTVNILISALEYLHNFLSREVQKLVPKEGTCFILQNLGLKMTFYLRCQINKNIGETVTLKK